MKIVRGSKPKSTEVPEKREYRQTGLYTKYDVNQLDGRTNIAKAIRALKWELEEYVGEVTVAASILIQRIVFKHMRLSQYENKSIENPENVEAQHYIPLANSLRLDLQTLKDLAGQKKAPPDLNSYLKSKKGDRE